jgi:hypothetical protein
LPSSPNLEDGFKNYGSYDSSHLDRVNLMNGNLMLHVPVLPAYPQRGNFTPQYSKMAADVRFLKPTSPTKPITEDGLALMLWAAWLR